MKSDPTSASGSSGRERAAQVARSRQKTGCASDWSLAGRLAGDGGKMVDAHRRSKRPYASQHGKMQPLPAPAAAAAQQCPNPSANRG